MEVETLRGRKFEPVLWLTAVLDALIVFFIGIKAFTGGLKGLDAWFRHLRLVPVSTANGIATFQIRPDYRFTVLYTTVIVGAFLLTVLLWRRRGQGDEERAKDTAVRGKC
jgi:hypothetical protein